MAAKLYQIVQGAPDDTTAARWFFRRWGYRPLEVLRSGEVHYAGPLKPWDLEQLQGALTDPDASPECSTANCG